MNGETPAFCWLYAVSLSASLSHTCAHTHTRTQSKAYGSHAKHSYCRSVNQHWDSCAPLRHSSLVQTNPTGASLEWTKQEILSNLMKNNTNECSMTMKSSTLILFIHCKIFIIHHCFIMGTSWGVDLNTTNNMLYICQSVLLHMQHRAE